MSPVTGTWHVFRVRALQGLAPQAMVSQSKSLFTPLMPGHSTHESATMRRLPCTLPLAFEQTGQIYRS